MLACDVPSPRNRRETYPVDDIRNSAKRIPEIGKSIGEGMKNYKKSLSEPDETNVTPEKDKEGAPTGREGEKGEHSLPEKKE
jgi:Sec-independent protein translocase protein TatA